MTDSERSVLGEKAGSYRLSCMTMAVGDCEIILPEEKSDFILSKGLLPTFELDPLGENYGFAVDIGTTTVAVYLYRLKSGEMLGYDAFLNPQASFGADVISRIEGAINGKAEDLSNAVKNALVKAFKDLCSKYKVDFSLVDTIVLTGNTTMLYLLLKENTAPLSKAPFEISNYLGDFCVEKGFFNDFLNAKVYLPRTISAFVGSDITCSLLVGTELAKTDHTLMLIDIGTNGEMALIKDNNLVCCSTAAGPAFEGAGITMGMMAKGGAIGRVYIENKKIKYTVINGEKPVGVCGSGLIDSVYVFLRLGLLDETGLIAEKSEEYGEYLTEYDGSPAIKIGDSGVLITQKDIRTFQLAKAAISAGIYSLAKEMDIELREVDKLLLAGGFGSFMDVEKAGEIGLIPKALADKAKPIGNAAGMGAAMILLSKKARDKSFSLAEKSKALDLSSSPYFMDKYIEQMIFN